MNNEIRIYVVDLSETKRGESFTQVSDFKEFVEEAERQGLVFSLSFFLNKLNNDEINITNSYSRAGIIKEGEEVEEIPFNITVTVSNEDKDCLNYGVEVDKIDHVEDCKTCIENCASCIKKYSCELCKQIEEKEKELIYGNNDKINQARKLAERNAIDDVIKFIIEQIDEHALSYRHNIDEVQLQLLKSIKAKVLHSKEIENKVFTFTEEETNFVNILCFDRLLELQNLKNTSKYKYYLNNDRIDKEITICRKIADMTCVEDEEE